MDPADKNTQTRNQNSSASQSFPAAPILSEPISGWQKEHQPIGSAESTKTQEFVRLSEPIPAIHQEVAKAGVETTDNLETLKLSPDAKKAGVTHSGAAVPVSAISGQSIQLPMSEGEAKNTLAKEKKVGNAIVWIATSVLRQIKRLHKKLRKEEA